MAPATMQITLISQVHNSMQNLTVSNKILVAVCRFIAADHTNDAFYASDAKKWATRTVTPSNGVEDLVLI